MRRYYAARIDRAMTRESGGRVWHQVWVATRALRRYGVHTDSGDRLASHLWQGPIAQLDAANGWLHYAQHVARVWSAILLAGELAGLNLDCPPVILADAVEDLGEPRLAEVIRRAYAPWCYGEEAPRPGNEMPGLPLGAPDHHTIIV